MVSSFGATKRKNKGDGAVFSKDDLVFTGGKYEINSQDHALEANDCVKITATELGITADGDGIHCENEEDANLGYVYIESGSIKIKCGGFGGFGGNSKGGRPKK